MLADVKTKHPNVKESIALVMFWYLVPILIASCSARKGFVQEYLVDAVCVCKTSKRFVYFAKSELQCVQKCLREPACHTINFRIGTKEEKSDYNCELFIAKQVTVGSRDCNEVLSSKGWTSMFLEVNYILTLSLQ